MKKRTAPQTDPAIEIEVRSIYKALSMRPVERECTLSTECCQFQRTGRTPHLTRGEAILAAKAFRATGRKQLPDSLEGACPLLNSKTERCLIYESRPFGCRTHFCRAAGGPYERSAVVDLIRRLETIDTHLGGDGPHPIQDALKSALGDFK